MTFREMPFEYWQGFLDGLIIAGQVLLIVWILFDIFHKTRRKEKPKP